MTINEEEETAAKILRNSARAMVKSYKTPVDEDTHTLAVLWAAFKTEAKENGITEWMGIEL